MVCILAVGGLLVVPSSDADGCAALTTHTIESRTIYGSETYNCTALTVKGTVTIADGGTLTLTDSMLDIIGAGLVHVRSGGKVVLDSTVFNGAGVQLDAEATLERSQTVHVKATGDGLGEGTGVWAWDGNGSTRLPSSGSNLLDGNNETTIQLPVMTHEGGHAPVHHFPWRIVTTNASADSPGGAINQTWLTVLPDVPGPLTVPLDIPVDDDGEAPRWTEDADITTLQGGAVPSGSATITWTPADDSNASWPIRAIDHYVLTHTAPGGSQTPHTVGATNQTSHLALTGLTQGVHVFTVRPYDLAWNAGPVSDEHQVIVDTQRPEIHWRLSPPLPTGENGWYNLAPTMSLEASDTGGSGLEAITYRLGGSAWTTYSGPITIQQSGDQLIQARATDQAGNTAEKNIHVPVDLVPPTVTINTAPSAGSTGWNNGPVDVLVDAVDSASGIDTLEYRVAGGTWTTFQPPLVLDHSGAHDLRIRATDRAGNVAEASKVVRIDGTAPIAPTVEWGVLEDGRITADWDSGPPVDLVSGVAKAYIERATASGEVKSRIEVSADQAHHVAGPYPVGEHLFRIAVQDLAGNDADGAWTTIPIERSTLDVHSDAQRPIVRGTVPLSFHSVGEFTPTEVRFYVDNALLTATSDGMTTIEWDTTQHADGTYEVRITGLDAEGSSQEHLQSVRIRNAYGSSLADHLVVLLLATTTILAAAGLGAFGGQRWRTWQDVIEGSASRHAITKHAPAHQMFEGAKILHLVSLVLAPVLGLIAYGLPAVLGSHTMSTVLGIVLAVAVLLVVSQAASLRFMMLRQRRIADEPHLQRQVSTRLEFDAPTHRPDRASNTEASKGNLHRFREVGGKDSS